MRFAAQTGQNELATVYVAQTDDGSLVECVESVQPPVPRSEKWVHIISTLKGCPIDCAICDAGGSYRGRLTAAEMVAQVDHLVRTRYPDGHPRTRKLKIQFARMGDPALNPAVVDALDELADRYGDGLFPSVSTIAPNSGSDVLEGLLALKERRFAGRFQMQFSLHTSDEERRRELVPARTWEFARMAEFGRRFHRPGERKVTLNFATPEGFELDAGRLAALFSPDHFAVKLTPVNPTDKVVAAGWRGLVDPSRPETGRRIAAAFEAVGFETILSIGELEENRIGSNCGMYVSRMTGAREAAC